jgi:hypothetical protein
MAIPMDPAPMDPAQPPSLAGGWPDWSSAKATALFPFASRYIWWKTPAEAVAQPDRVIAQVMTIGDHRDVEAMARLVGDAVLRDVLTHAEAGQFSARAWTYWHYRLELAELGHVPPLPCRRFP